MKAYITGKGIISAIGNGKYELKVPEVNNSFLACQKPDFIKYFDAKQARRTSKILKMSLVAAFDALSNNRENIDGIIVGTGLGCIGDSEKFITALLNYEEAMLSPTPFIQSTHNTIAGNIALQLKAHQYNCTYSERIFSFEWALLDALMQLNESEKNARFLVGSADELTENTFKIAKALKMYDDYTALNCNILKNKKASTIAGEHAAFFTLEKQAANVPVLHFIKMFFQEKPSSCFNEVLNEIKKLDFEKVDCILMGINGHQIYDKVYDEIETYFPDSNLAYFKHLSGESLTSSSFALWLATEIIENNNLPEVITINKKNKNNNNILIINHLKKDYLSTVFVSR